MPNLALQVAKKTGAGQNPAKTIQCRVSLEPTIPFPICCANSQPIINFDRREPSMATNEKPEIDELEVELDFWQTYREIFRRKGLDIAQFYSLLASQIEEPCRQK
jgi:hypothetical protein